MPMILYVYSLGRKSWQEMLGVGFTDIRHHTAPVEYFRTLSSKISLTSFDVPPKFACIGCPQGMQQKYETAVKCVAAHLNDISKSGRMHAYLGMSKCRKWTKLMSCNHLCCHQGSPEKLWWGTAGNYPANRRMNGKIWEDATLLKRKHWLLVRWDPGLKAKLPQVFCNAARKLSAAEAKSRRRRSN